MFRSLLRKLWRPRLIRFAVVGLSGVFVNLAAFFVLADVIYLDEWVGAHAGLTLEVFGVRAVLASATAIEISIVWNFLLNNAWTFRDKNELARGGFFSRMLAYNLVSLVGLGIQVATFVALSAFFVRTFGLDDVGLWKYPAQLVGIGIAMAWNFVSNFYFTWAQRDAPSSKTDDEPTTTERVAERSP